MGSLSDRSHFNKGLFAKPMYRSLHLMHEQALNRKRHVRGKRPCL